MTAVPEGELASTSGTSTLSANGQLVELIKEAGLMPTGPSNTVLIQGDAATATGVGITVEPAAGSDTPTLPPVALIPFT